MLLGRLALRKYRPSESRATTGEGRYGSRNFRTATGPEPGPPPPWGVENVKRSNADWTAHGGEIIALAPAEQTAMMASFVLLGTKIVEQNPAVKSEFDKLKALVDAKRPN